jgi:competence protein ComEA
MLALVLDASSARAKAVPEPGAPEPEAAAAPVAAAPVAAAPVAAAAHRSTEGVVNLNDASENQLALLPGIGPGKARAISEHRHAHPFHRVDELTKVKGIGRKTFGRLRPYITTVGPTTLDREVKLHR